VNSGRNVAARHGDGTSTVLLEAAADGHRHHPSRVMCDAQTGQRLPE